MSGRLGGRLPNHRTSIKVTPSAAVVPIQAFFPIVRSSFKGSSAESSPEPSVVTYVRLS